MSKRDVRGGREGNVKRGGQIGRIEKAMREVIGQERIRVEAGVGILEPDNPKELGRTQEDNKGNLIEIEVAACLPNDQRKTPQELDQNQLHNNTRDQRQGTGPKGGTWKCTERKRRELV